MDWGPEEFPAALAGEVSVTSFARIVWAKVGIKNPYASVATAQAGLSPKAVHFAATAAHARTVAMLYKGMKE